MDPAVTGGRAARLGGPAGGNGAARTPAQAVLVIKPSFVVRGGHSGVDGGESRVERGDHSVIIVIIIIRALLLQTNRREELVA